MLVVVSLTGILVMGHCCTFVDITARWSWSLLSAGMPVLVDTSYHHIVTSQFDQLTHQRGWHIQKLSDRKEALLGRRLALSLHRLVWCRRLVSPLQPTRHHWVLSLPATRHVCSFIDVWRNSFLSDLFRTGHWKESRRRPAQKLM